MSKAKLILIGLVIGLNLTLAARYAWVEYLWTYKRPIVQEVHTSQTYITGPNATVSQEIDTKKQKNWFIGAFGGYKSGGVVIGKVF